MPGGLLDSSLTRVQPFFGTLIDADPPGKTWLPPLIRATPHGATVFRSVLDDPGPLLTRLTSQSPSGMLGCFEYPVGPPRGLLAWFVENPDQFVWPETPKLSPETMRLRRALLDDAPPGSRAIAQRQARDLVAKRSPRTRAWWRFEGTTMLDCVLMTDRLAMTVEGKRTEPLSAATD